MLFQRRYLTGSTRPHLCAPSGRQCTQFRQQRFRATLSRMTHITITQHRSSTTRFRLRMHVTGWNTAFDLSPRQAFHALPAPAAFASSAAATAGFTFFPSFQRMRGGGARLRRPSRDRTRTTGIHITQRAADGSRDVLTMRMNCARDTICDFDV